MTRKPRMVNHSSAPHIGARLATIICLPQPHASRSMRTYAFAEAHA
jgi:hypothetical protein